MLKKLFIIFTLLFMASSTAFADGIVPVICFMEEFNYCKDIKKIIEYSYDAYKNNDFPNKVYQKNQFGTIKEYSYDAYKNSDLPSKVYKIFHY